MGEGESRVGETDNNATQQDDGRLFVAVLMGEGFPFFKSDAYGP